MTGLYRSGLRRNSQLFPSAGKSPALMSKSETEGRYISMKMNGILMTALLSAYHTIGAGIICRTERKAKQFIKDILLIQDKEGNCPVIWCGGKSIKKGETRWEEFREKTIYVMRDWYCIDIVSIDTYRGNFISYKYIHPSLFPLKSHRRNGKRGTQWKK